MTVDSAKKIHKIHT